MHLTVRPHGGRLMPKMRRTAEEIEAAASPSHKGGISAGRNAVSFEFLYFHYAMRRRLSRIPMALTAHHGGWIHEEAAMAAIAFNAAQRAAGRFEAVLTAVREMIDAFVSYQMRQAAAEAEPARTPPDDERAGTATPFRPLDASIVSDAIPEFFIGRNREGFWVARERRDGSAEFSCSRLPHCRSQERIAGQRDAQRSFRPTGSNSTWRTAAIRYPHLRPLMRLALHLQQRALAGVGQITAAIERRKKA